MSKYYTPEIEEFHIGFEFEGLERISFGSNKKHWVRWTLDTDRHFQKRNWEFILENINEVRVKFLDREDIESLGFTFKTEDNNTDLFINFKFNVSIIYNFETKVLRMITMDLAKSELYHEIQMDPHRIGGIIIKNKSEFKKLLTQLNLL